MKFKVGDLVKLSPEGLAYAKTDQQKLRWPLQRGEILSIKSVWIKNLRNWMTLIKVSFSDTYLKSISFEPFHLKLVKD